MTMTLRRHLLYNPTHAPVSKKASNRAKPKVAKRCYSRKPNDKSPLTDIQHLPYNRKTHMSKPKFVYIVRVRMVFIVIVHPNLPDPPVLSLHLARG
jgi:hypothetical protein